MGVNDIIKIGRFANFFLFLDLFLVMDSTRSTPLTVINSKQMIKFGYDTCPLCRAANKVHRTPTIKSSTST